MGGARRAREDARGGWEGGGVVRVWQRLEELAKVKGDICCGISVP